MHKATSSRVSSLTAEILQTHAPITAGTVVEHQPGIEFIEKRLYEDLLAKAKTLAGSCMSQDETAGQAPETFLDRMKRERSDLDERVTKLAAFLNKGHGFGPRQNELLKRQLIAMSEYLVVLDERLADLAISDRSAPVEEVEELDEDDGA